MKKILLIGLMVLISVTLFATEGERPGLSFSAIPADGTSTDAVVKLNLAETGEGGSEANFKYLIGFINTDTIDTDITAESNETTITGNSEFELVFDPSDNKGKLSSGSYIYWILKGPSKLSISFYTDANMSGTEATLGWETNVSAGKLNGAEFGSASEISTKAGEPSVLYNRADNTKGFIDYGYIPFSITTDTLVGKPAVNYSGNLHLVVKSTT